MKLNSRVDASIDGNAAGPVRRAPSFLSQDSLIQKLEVLPVIRNAILDHGFAKCLVLRAR